MFVKFAHLFSLYVNIVYLSACLSNSRFFFLDTEIRSAEISVKYVQNFNIYKYKTPVIQLKIM